MPRRTLNLLFAALLLGGVACEPSPDRSTVASAGDDHAADDHAAGDHATSAHAAAGEGGMALLPIMQGLGSDMTALTYALMTEDHDGVAKHAAAIAEHAPISAAELERIHRVLGSDMARFEAVDESVHVASVRLRDAARAHQPDQVVTRLAEVQRGCVSCHTQFRERLRTNPAAPKAP